MHLFVTRVLQAVLDADIHRASRARNTAAAPRELRLLQSEWGTVSLLIPMGARTRVLARFTKTQHRCMIWLKSALITGEVSVTQVGVLASELCGAALSPPTVRQVTAQINWEIAGSIRRQMLRDHPWLNSLERVHARALCGDEEE